MKEQAKTNKTTHREKKESEKGKEGYQFRSRGLFYTFLVPQLRGNTEIVQEDRERVRGRYV